MTVHLTEAEARRLGIKGAPAARRKTTSKAAPSADCAPNRCCTCGQIFTDETAEARHNADTRHARYAMVSDG